MNVVRATGGGGGGDTNENYKIENGKK